MTAASAKEPAPNTWPTVNAMTTPPHKGTPQYAVDAIVAGTTVDRSVATVPAIQPNNARAPAPLPAQAQSNGVRHTTANGQSPQLGCANA